MGEDRRRRRRSRSRSARSTSRSRSKRTRGSESRSRAADVRRPAKTEPGAAGDASQRRGDNSKSSPRRHRTETKPDIDKPRTRHTNHDKRTVKRETPPTQSSVVRKRSPVSERTGLGGRDWGRGPAAPPGGAFDDDPDLPSQGPRSRVYRPGQPDQESQLKLFDPTEVPKGSFFEHDDRARSGPSGPQSNFRGRFQRPNVGQPDNFRGRGSFQNGGRYEQRPLPFGWRDQQDNLDPPPKEFNPDDNYRSRPDSYRNRPAPYRNPVSDDKPAPFPYRSSGGSDGVWKHDLFTTLLPEKGEVVDEKTEKVNKVER